jgi:hypothetical protein
MPPALWTAAIAPARQHGLYTTARALHLDYGSLKKRRDAAAATGESGASTGGELASRARRRPTDRRTGDVVVPTFIELPGARQPGLGPCVIDVAAPHGGRLRIEVTGVTIADLVTLTQGAWGGSP